MCMYIIYIHIYIYIYIFMYMCILQTYNYICVIYLDSFRQLESSVTIIFGKSIKYLFLFFSSKHVP